MSVGNEGALIIRIKADVSVSNVIKRKEITDYEANLYIFLAHDCSHGPSRAPADQHKLLTGETIQEHSYTLPVREDPRG